MNELSLFLAEYPLEGHPRDRKDLWDSVTVSSACFRYQGQRQVPRVLVWDPRGQKDPKIKYTMQWREVSLRSPQEGGTGML